MLVFSEKKLENPKFGSNRHLTNKC